MVHSRKLLLAVSALLLIPMVALMAFQPAAAPDTSQLDYIRPGIVVKIASAAIAKDGTITARVKITDPKGVPLDREGIATAGTVAMSLIAAHIPAGQKQYVSYTTTTLRATINNNPAQIQAGNDSGGTWAANAVGDYTYTFRTKAPTTFDATVTHAIGITAVRNLSEFLTYTESSQASNDVFTFVPNGAPVTVVRSIVATKACNACHDPMFGHGGSRIAVEHCILCHTPQTINPDTLLTQDMPVLIHKIHMGSSLPSVKAGTPYRIWHRGAWTDFSEVVYPQDPRNCRSCHTSGQAQTDNWKTNPSSAACGACHDDVNFATGENHVGLPVNDAQCATCHTAAAMADFDASVPGAHAIPNRAALLPGIIAKILKVDGTAPGSAPTVSFSVMDKAGSPVDISKLTQFRILLAGPNTDYQTGAGAIRVTEDARAAAGSNGAYSYTMTNKIPAAATGSYTVSIEARNTVTLMGGTVKQMTATDSALPVESYFSVDRTPVAPRRAVVSTAKCSACHSDLKFIHGGTRGEAQECTLCHNPALVDGTSKQSVNFAWMVHSIHRGAGLANPYVLGTINYQEVRYPGDIRNCLTCHVSTATYQPENVGAQVNVASPGSFTPTTPPISAACLACHDTRAAASHALANTTVIGESCASCHGASSDFSMDKVHAKVR